MSKPFRNVPYDAAWFEELAMDGEIWFEVAEHADRVLARRKEEETDR